MKRPPILMVILSVLAGLGIIQMTVLIGYSIYRTVEFHQQINELEGRVSLLKQDVADLKNMRQKSYDPEFLRQLARCQGFVGEKEEILVDKNARQDVNEAECRLPVLRP
ncbi:septum formation initiator family protein [Deinococcus misasensis]|uniref:septum formation initiator family protein n=1 Tax=Deinococcus misasensis TaxID=392413 RepID=UPI00068A54D6|nr:septum formation initiator family protein [Deinococcus misasensis]